MRIAYLILAHEKPDLIARLIRLLLRGPSCVVVHYDLKAGEAPLAKLRELLEDFADRVHFAERVSVRWGDWSMVEATLNGLETIERGGLAVDYVHLMSGADYPVRPLAMFAEYLERSAGREFIECVDITKRQWVRIGPERERYWYRHYFNWRSSPRLSHASWNLQRKLGLERRMPMGLVPHLGSQWWTLTRETAGMLLAAGRDPRLVRFFRRVAIPDEMFFQTIVADRVPRDKIWGRSLTHYQFTDYGVPVVFHNDHGDFLARQPAFFARKISPYATRLRDRLDAHATGAEPTRSFADDEYGKVSDEYEKARVASRTPRFGRRVISHQTDGWRGDLAELRTPYLMIVGASREEVRFVSDIIAATGAFLCHGSLFDPHEIEFAGKVRRFAGYGCHDLALRDHSRTSFLSDVVHSGGRKRAAFHLPWRTDDALMRLLVRCSPTQLLVVRGNVFRAFLEHRHSRATPGETIRLAEFDRFYGAYNHFHETELEAGCLENPAMVRTEIVLANDDWIETLVAFLLRCLGQDARSDRLERLLTRDFVLDRARALSDPALYVANVHSLASIRIDGQSRTRSRDLLAETPDWPVDRSADESGQREEQG